MISLSDDVRVV